ncbi:hypothetical protein Q671_04945 [Halomonas sp. PBN3]|nr:hypothetical protein Q671_04945 [Halomonas sp. PBN3]
MEVENGMRKILHRVVRWMMQKKKMQVLVKAIEAI